MSTLLTNILLILFFNSVFNASVLDNVIGFLEKERDVIADISQNGYYHIKEHAVEYSHSVEGLRKNVGIDVLKADGVHWIKNGTYKVINLAEEGYERVAENGIVTWKKGEELLLRVPEVFYNDILKGDLISRTQMNVSGYVSHEGCSCVNSTFCMCCVHITEVTDDLICAGLQLLPDDYGIRAFFIIGNFTISKDISVRNPPLLCVVNIYKELQLCVEIYDIDTSFKTLHGCLALGFRAYRIHPVFIKLGCITAFDDGLPAPMDRCAGHISSSSFALTCSEKMGRKADFFILNLQQNNNNIQKKIRNEPDFNITSLKAETVYEVSIIPAIVKRHGPSFTFTLNTSSPGGEDFDKIFVNNVATTWTVQIPATVLIVYTLYVIANFT